MTFDNQTLTIIAGVVVALFTGGAIFSYKASKKKTVNQNNNTIGGNGDIVGGDKTTVN
ncbi:hypothetical protein KTO58_19295 [Chitinophaga pendula]|uniref:hypothetical protein n=1 Tax=Chitinophaga TaxID=79328 RepID=UPI0012FE23E8|nr:MULTISPECIES: hypothetical protein [Chitinophaga]UCJ05821.1 hypothetical protein KTO58_19295 [Chitinophaga pendula]